LELLKAIEWLISSSTDEWHDKMRRRFVMLDRDGTLIFDRHYLSSPEMVELLPGVVDGLRVMREMGLGLVVLTNQSGVGRGLFDLSALDRVHDRLKLLLKKNGLEVDGIYFCPHLPEDGCDCRKPAAGMAIRASKELDFDTKEAFMIGDKAIDMKFGKSVGATTLLVLTGYGKEQREMCVVETDYVANDLICAARIIHQLNHSSSCFTGSA
jgi:D-glycero-D-manno-heptose 1,7-bisphosphate phosphatase